MSTFEARLWDAIVPQIKDPAAREAAQAGELLVYTDGRLLVHVPAACRAALESSWTEIDVLLEVQADVEAGVRTHRPARLVVVSPLPHPHGLADTAELGDMEDAGERVREVLRRADLPVAEGDGAAGVRLTRKELEDPRRYPNPDYIVARWQGPGAEPVELARVLSGAGLVTRDRPGGALTVWLHQLAIFTALAYGRI